MKNYAGAVEEAVLQYEPNQIIVANELYHAMLSYIPEQTFYKTMERLVKSGKLVHLTKGLYYRPKRTRFGNVPISEEEISRHYLSNGEGLLVGYRMYNREGITTQVGKQVEIFSNSIMEEKKHIQNVSVRKISAELNEKTIPIIEILEILQNYRRIEDMNPKALGAYMEAFSRKYSDEAAQYILSRMKYKKSTIAFLSSVLNHFKVKNTLGSHLSPLSDYKIPDVEEIL